MGPHSQDGNIQTHLEVNGPSQDSSVECEAAVQKGTNTQVKTVYFPFKGPAHPFEGDSIYVAEETL